MSVEAQQAMRRHSRSKGSTRAVGMALAFYAQRGTFLAWPSNRELEAFTALDERTVQRALGELERKLCEVRRCPGLESHARRRVYLVCPEQGVQLSLLDPATGGSVPPSRRAQRRGGTAPPVTESETGDTHARACKEPTEPTHDVADATPCKGARTSHKHAVRQGDLPPAFPDDLRPCVEQVLDVLIRIQEQRGGNSPTRRGVGIAVTALRDRDHVQAVRELEHWALAGNGQSRQIRDWVRQYRAFLERMPVGAPPTATPIAAVTVSGDGYEAVRARRHQSLREMTGLEDRS